jgi:hypothetical protein
MLSPVLAVVGSTNNTTTIVYDSKDFDSDVGIDAGDTLYYTLDQLAFPPGFTIPDITLPDFTGSTLYIKVSHIDEDVEFAPGVIGTEVHYGLGLLFNDDKVLTIGAGLTATDIILPEGSGTPAIEMSGLPHWNTTFGSSPALFFINDDYAHHTFFLEALNFTVTETVDSFHAIQTNETSGGSIEGNWRKSDGICTHLLIDNIAFGPADFTDVTIEITLDKVEKRPLPITAGDVIEFTSDLIDVSVSGDLINETTLSLINEDIAAIKAAYENKVLMKYVVTDVEGIFYMCDVYFYDNWTDSMIKSDIPTVFNGFVGLIWDSYYHIPFEPVITTPGKGPGYSVFNGPGPFVTPDWDIYEAEMNLYNTLLSVYAVDILELISPPDYLTYHALGGNMELISKQDFYYFYEALNVQIEEDLLTSSPIIPEMVYDTGSIYSIQEEGYVCYHETGIGAVIRVKADFEAEVYDTGTMYDTGIMNVDVNVKLRNHDYDPPEIIKGGILPGFNWIIAIPTLLGLAAIGLIARKRK